MDEDKVGAFDSKDMGEIGTAMEVLTRVDLELAYSSKKIAHLDKLLIHLMFCEYDLETKSLKNEKDTDDLFHQSLAFDFLSEFLNSEVRELDVSIGSLQEVISDARSKISVFRDLTDLFEVVEAKLHDSEDLLKQSREHILQIDLLSAKLTKAPYTFYQNDCSYDKNTNLSESGVNTEEKLKIHLEQKRHILKILEKSQARELNLEKELSEFKQNEEDLKLKQRLTEQVSFAMEEAAEAVWGWFLEAENAKEVLLSTSKEMLNRLQSLEFNLNGSMQRENEAKWKLVNCMEQLKERDNALQKLENSISELISDNMEVCSLREKVKMLEQQMKESDSKLLSANNLNEENEDHISTMENIIESLKENIDLAENKADSAEAKITELTEANSELNEELSFLKSTNDSNKKKVSVIENQLRDSEIQLQHARASSEASQEQQNMLYSAIWDMETLIEELKSKFSKAEMKTENVEERCILLSETNAELNKEMTLLRNKVESLEICLEQANSEKVAIAEDVNVKTKIIMDMVVQLALERKRIQKQMFGLVEANKVLVEKFQKSETGESAIDGTRGTYIRAILSANNAIGRVPSESFTQVDESTKDQDIRETEPRIRSSNSPDDNCNIVPKHDPQIASHSEGSNEYNQIYVYFPILIFLFSILSIYLLNKNTKI